jgi:hypothetical protein
MKIIAILFETASDLVRWLTGNTTRMVFVLGVVVVLPLSLIFGSMIFSGNESSQGAAWREYYQAREEVISGRQDVDWLEALILFGPQSDFHGNHLRSSSTPRLWALQFAGDMELADGSRLVYTDREEAAERLEHAIEFYDRIRKEGGEGMIAERALLGKAHAHEILLVCTPDLSEFKNNYDMAIFCLDSVTEMATNSAIKATARHRKQVLLEFGKDNWSEGNLSPGDFYSWLGQFTPPDDPINPFPINPSPFDPPPAPFVPFPDEGELLPPPVLGAERDFLIEPVESPDSDEAPAGDEGDEGTPPSTPPAGDEGDEGTPPSTPPAGEPDDDPQGG